MGRIYSLANQKGGVGKTTTAVNLGAYLAHMGQRVLLVDLDPQANATSSLGVDKNALSRSVYDVLIGSETPASLTLVTTCLGLDLLPASPALAGAEVELLNVIARETRLRHALQQVSGRYDYILIDTPPSLGMLTVNALTASDGVFIPIQCEYLPLEGLAQLLHTIELIRQRLNPDLMVRGLILTMYDRRTNLARQVVQEIHDHFPTTVFQSVIPRNVKLSEAPSYGEPILTYAPDSPGGLAYEALCQEILSSERI
ncbi:MAG: ParA family protein [Chloroflexi bacterium]|nr:ParA family protein [Chloroflexota bacterium]